MSSSKHVPSRGLGRTLADASLPSPEVPERSWDLGSSHQFWKLSQISGMLEFKRSLAHFPEKEHEAQRGEGIGLRSHSMLDELEFARRRWEFYEQVSIHFPFSGYRTTVSYWRTSSVPSQSTRFGWGAPGPYLQGWPYDQVWLQ